MRYLTNEQLRSNLSLGRSAEQLLQPKKYDTYVKLRWIAIDRNRDSTYTTRYMECFDDGNENFTDIYEFSSVHPDEPEVLNTFDAIEEALEFVTTTYGAQPGKFVTAGMIQEEYRDYLNSDNSL